MNRPPSSTVRHLTIAQALYVGGSTVDLTLTGIVGAHLAPSSALATLPFSIIFLAAGISTFFISRIIGTLGHRTAFVTAGCIAALSGVVSAIAIQTQLFWLFCIGTALIGVYTASAGYYRYLAAESMPHERARAVSAVLAGGLVAALVGPFLATIVRNVTATPYVASYLLVAVLGAAAAIWNTRLVSPRSLHDGAGAQRDAPRATRVLWLQPQLLLGVGTAVLAACTMLAMMTAGPILGLTVGHTPAEAALAIQLHMVGMYAPGFLVARVMARVGERVIALIGTVLIVVAGLAALTSAGLPAYFLAMFAVGVGWNLAYSGGSALIAASYRAAERSRVQPFAEILIIAAQVGGSLSAAGFTTLQGWHVLGIGCIALAAITALVITGTFLKKLVPGASALGVANDGDRT